MAQPANFYIDDPKLTQVVVPVRSTYQDWIIPIMEWLEDPLRPGLYMAIWATDAPESTKMRFFFTHSSVAVEFRVRWG